MEKNKQKCSLEKHSEKFAVIYCNICSIYMCRKCETHHSELFPYHNPVSLDKNSNESITQTCQEENHSNQQLKYYCNTHKILCCDLCINSLKTKDNGKHSCCEIYSLNEIKERKRSEFKFKINNLEKNNKIFNDLLKDMENIYEIINEKKDKIKIKIQKIFTEIRNNLNNREDEFYEELDKRFNDIYFNENIINENIILKNKIKAYLDKNKTININMIDINLFNNEIDILNKNCESIENKIKELSSLVDKGKNYKVEIEFKTESNEVGEMINQVKNFGDIYINENNGIKIYQCFKSFTPIEKPQYDVLLISKRKFPMLHNLLKLIKKINKIFIFPPEEIIPKMIYKDIKKYKIIIYDLQDNDYCKTTNYFDIKKYLEDGGNIIVTHDHWTYRSTDCVQLLDANYKLRNECPRTKKAKILNNTHPIFKSHNELNLQKNSLIDIAMTHRTNLEFNDMKVYLKDLLIELNDDKHGEYLLVKEIGKGKLIYWNAGHSYQVGNHVDIKEIEQKLFENFVYWIFG